MEGKFNWAAGLLVAAIALYFVTRESATELSSLGAGQVPEDEHGPEVAEPLPVIKSQEAEAGTRVPIVESEDSTTASIAHARTLRVILEGLSEPEAQRASMTVHGLDENGALASQIQESWQAQGSVSEFDLEAFFASLDSHGETARLQGLEIAVDHPNYLIESSHLSLSDAVAQADGSMVYEFRVQLTEVQFWSEFKLTVRDAHTREHLKDVELHFVPTAFMGIMQQPERTAPYTFLADGLHSPITLLGGRKEDGREDWVAGIALQQADGSAPELAELAQPEDNARGLVVFAGAPGYAWGRMVIDLSSGSESEILLEPGSALSLRLSHVQLQRYAEIGQEAWIYLNQLQTDGGTSTVMVRRVDAFVEANGLQLDGLAPGDYAVSVELGGVFAFRRARPVLGREEFSLAAGEGREVVLSLADAPAPPELTTLSGVVSLPSFGGEDSVRLQLFHSDFRYGDPDIELALTEMEAVGGVLPSWAFQVQDLRVGTYQANLWPFQKSWMIELPAQGLDGLELTIPELAEVRVETVDARTGAPIPLKTIRYGQREELPGQVSKQGVVVDAEDDQGRFRFWSVPGAAHFHAYRMSSELGYGQRGYELELVPGVQSVRYELESSYVIRFEFRDGGALLPHADEIYTDVLGGVRSVDHPGRVVQIAIGRVDLSAPGIYEVSFDGVGDERFLPIPTRQVVVEAGKATTVVVELQRK